MSLGKIIQIDVLITVFHNLSIQMNPLAVKMVDILPIYKFFFVLGVGRGEIYTLLVVNLRT